MPVPDFSTGEVLTAAAMDSIGLWLVKTQTVSSSPAVSSVTVTGAFSADYDNYKIQWSGNSSIATGSAIDMQMGATAAGYFGALQYASYAGVGGTVVGDNNVSAWTHCAGAVNNQVVLDLDLYKPFLADETTISTRLYTDAANTGVKTGFLNNNTSYTSFTLIGATASTINSGTIRVYGYRK